jgi:translation initiation factor 2 subunit 3
MLSVLRLRGFCEKTFINTPLILNIVATKAKTKKTKSKSSQSVKKTNNVSQPEVNIGLVGHVDHGKTTLTDRLTGKWTDTHSEELKRGITIRLGYADTEIRKCDKCSAYTTKSKCPKCKGTTTVLRKISLVDAPGHESLMATMLAGSTIIDGAILLISATEDCPQPQTREHITALQIAGIKNVIVVQNKVDLVTEADAVENYEQIKEFLSGTEYKDTPIIPISARSGVNIDIVIEAIQDFIPTPKRDPGAKSLMLVARSFDVNKPGTEIEKLTGGVLGGTLKQGVLNVDDDIEIRPGRAVEERNKKIWKPVLTKITGLKSGGKNLDMLGPGGSIGVMTQLDPALVKQDSLAGSVAGKIDELPPVWYEFMLKIHLLDRVVGVEDELEVKPIQKGELLMLNVNSAATVGTVTELKKDSIKCVLKKPVCADEGARITLSRRIGTRFRLIGYGEIVG